MLRVEVNITDEGLRAALARVQGDLERTTELHQAMAQGVEETVRGHLLTLNSRSPRTGFYAKAARSVESKWSATGRKFKVIKTTRDAGTRTVHLTLEELP